MNPSACQPYGMTGGENQSVTNSSSAGSASDTARCARHLLRASVTEQLNRCRAHRAVEDALPTDEELVNTD